MSITFQKDSSKRHTSLVISPLKALIHDQVEGLRQHNIAAYGIYEGIDRTDIEGNNIFIS